MTTYSMKCNIIKVSLFLCILCLSFSQNCQAQKKIKHGKPTEEELAMTVYEPDKDAEAVILYERNEVWYDILNSISLYYEREVRIKILKDEGKSWADFAVPFRKQSDAQEWFEDLKACAINMVNGKAVKTDVSKEFINNEVVSGSHYLKKIAVPEVRVGTIIDLKYRIKSDFIANIPSINLQHSIPVKYSYFSLRIPSYLSCNVNSRGYVHLNPKFKEYPSSTDHRFTINETINEQEDIPALKKTNLVYYPEDYITGFDYDISSIHFLDLLNKTFSVTWEDLCNTLYEDNQFGDCMRARSQFDAETQPIAESNLSDAEKISKIAKVVRSHVRWNDRYSLYCSKEGLRSAVKKGVGNSADMNFLLYCSLVTAKYKVAPVFVNPRHMGRLPFGRPLIDRLNAFILQVKGTDGRVYYIDAADKNSDVNVLPYNLAIMNAHVFNLNKEGEVVDLTNLSKHQEVMQIETTIDGNGMLKSQVSTRYTNLMAAEKITEYQKYSSEEEYIENMEKHDEVTIDDYTINGLDTMTVTERYIMTKQLDSNESLHLLDATMGLMTVANPFTEENRVLPVEFDFPQSYTIASNIRIPENYTIEDFPKSAQLEFGNKDISLNFRCNASEKGIFTQIRYTKNRLLFAGNEYSELFEFFSKMAEVFKQKIVLKKK